MVIKIQKWGSGIGVRLPRSVAQEAQLSAGSLVEISVTGGILTIRPPGVGKYKLSDLLAGVNPRNLHREVSTGRRVGREVR